MKIERDYGAGGVQVAYEYGYNSDGVRVWKRDGLAGQEYRYVCGIGCDGVPMRVYSRLTTGNEWLDCQPCCRQKGHRGVIKGAEEKLLTSIYEIVFVGAFRSLLCSISALVATKAILVYAVRKDT